MRRKEGFIYSPPQETKIFINEEGEKQFQFKEE